MRLSLPRNISLANKCLLLFGGAVVLIVIAAMIGPWLRMRELVRERQMEILRRDVDLWQRLEQQAASRGDRPEEGPGGVEYFGITARWIPAGRFDDAIEELPWLDDVLERFRDEPARLELMDSYDEDDARVYRYARAIRGMSPSSSGLADALDATAPDPDTGPESGEAAIEQDQPPAGDETPQPRRELLGVLIAFERTDKTGVLMTVNTVYLVSAGMVVLALAVVVFYIVTHRIVLVPVRQLRETAEQVREGDLTIRSSIRTGDEYEELALAFNAMLGKLQESSDRQRSINRALDLKLGELAEANTALYEANRVKAEFLASVSHELRTPLNSIIGFAELLLEIANSEPETDDAAQNTKLTKRRRYLEHIVTAGQHLMGLIEGLLEMAKIEAGKIEFKPEPVDLADLCGVLASMVHPQAARKGVEVRVDTQPGLPIVRSDPKRLQQVLYNFLSNAVKFIEDDASDRAVTLRAERVIAKNPSEHDRVRLSVIDTGPGIPPDEQERIFEKFHRLDQTHAPDRGGAGLGLAICRELAKVLQGELEVSSAIGSGSVFGLVIPVEPDEVRSREVRLENAFRGALLEEGAGSKPKGDADQRSVTAAG